MIGFRRWLIYLPAAVFLWISVSGRATPLQLGWGLVVGLLTMPLCWGIFSLEKRIDPRAFLYGAWGWISWFLFLFIPEAVLSSLDMARRVVQPVIPMRPGIVAVPIRFRGTADALMLTNHVTLTPGTIVVDVDEQGGWFYVHTIDASDPERLRRDVQHLQEQVVRRLYR